MKKILILTKTSWSEPPRIRHQITRLLNEKGYEITFVEKCSYKSIFIKKRTEENIDFYSHPELIHHQLRYIPLFQKLNNSVVKFYLKKIIKQIKFDLIINFNYDNSFLKEIASNKKIITIINDDFEAQAKFGMKTQIRRQIKSTCENSDYVLTVSYPLFNKLQGYKNNVRLFLPWSQKKYNPPKKNITKRSTVLYFGFIGRLDWEVVELLISSTQYNYRFVGPPKKKSDAKIITYLKTKYNNKFEYIQYEKIEDLNVDDVFCSLLPYDVNLHSVQACTISNRAFNLLSLGLPLVYADLKYLIEAPITVMKANENLEDYQKTLKYYHENFYTLQKDIKGFLDNHYSENRWKILKQIINE